MKRVLATIVFAFALFLFSGTVYGGTVPPSPTNSFYGDASGDMIIDAAEITAMRAWILGQPYVYDTIQPATPTQDWNTSDVTSDILIDAGDVSVIRSWILGFPISIADKPWVLSNENLPLINNPTATPIAFQMNLASTLGTMWGRAGLPVVAQIDAGGSTTTGSLVGRTCAPVAGSRDQSTTPGDQCALSVSVTDWYGVPGATKGLTETGTYGLSVVGNGTGNLRIVFSINSFPPGLDIPAITTALLVGFFGGPVNVPPVWDTPPANISGVAIGSTYGPAVNGQASDADVGETLTCSSNGTSCTFPVNVTGSSASPVSCSVGFTADLTAQTCNLRVVVTDDGIGALSVGATISITTVNNAPTWSTAPGNINAGWGQVYSAVDGIATDADTGETLTCSSNGTSCVGFPVGPTVSGSGPKPQSCTVGFTAPGANQTCNLRIMVSDNGSPAATLGATIQIIVTGNAAPVFTTTGGTTARQGLLYSYTAGTSDPDVGQTLVCTLGTVNTCGGSLPADTPGLSPHNCPAYTFTPGAGLQSCQFRLVVSDNFVPAATAGQTTTVTINRAPTWSTAPFTPWNFNLGQTVNQIDGVAIDPDLPAQNLTCSNNGTTCTFAVAITGSSTSPVSCNWSFTTNLTAQTCTVRIMVADNGTPAMTLGFTKTINTQNAAPTFTTTGGTTARQGLQYSYTAGTSDVDTGENLTCTIGTVNTCAGTMPADTPGLKPHNCPAYTFTPGAALQSCQFRLVVTDNGSPAATAGQTTTVTINRAPTWSTAPSNIAGVPIGSTYGPTANGIAQDVDVPAQVLTCSNNGTSCSFVVNVTGSGTSPRTCSVGFTANLAAATCNLRIMVTDAGTPAATLGTTITITTVNNPPTFTTTGPTTARQGLAYSYAAGTTDLDTGENLSCTISGAVNTCAGFLNAETPGPKPHTCPLYNFTPGAGLQTCQFRIIVTDNGTPAATAGQTTTVTINRTPTWSTAPTNITGVPLGSTRAPAVDGIATDVDVPAQILTCSSGGTSCTFTPTVTGSSVAPTSCLVGFTANLTAQTCNLRIVVTDAGTPAATLGTTIQITTVNMAPTWTMAPANITLCPGSVYNQNSIATDGDTGETLTCSNSGSLCGATVTGSSVKPVTCNMTGSMGASTCNLRMMVADNGVPSATLGATVSLITRPPGDCGPGGPTWNSVSTQTAVTPFNSPPPTVVIPRIQSNYPANWNRVVLNFSSAITACTAVVSCGGTGQTVTPTVSGSSCILTVTSGGGIWTENRDCVIQTVTSTPACSNCGGLNSVFHTSIALANCAARGGTCGGFIDDGTYGTGNTLDVRVVDWRTGTLFCAEAAVCGTATNLNHSYVLVEQPNQTPLVRIEKFDANDDGIVAVTGTGGDLMRSDVVKVTAAYKGRTGMCENSFGEATKCYQISTFDNVDSRRILVPLEFTNSADWQLPEAQLWGYVPITGFSKYVGPRMGNLDRFPNPLRAGFVVLSLLDQSMSSINLEDLLRSTGDKSTINLCFAELGASVGNLSLPGNLMIPDLIRQQWNAPCVGDMKMSAGNTNFRVYTNRGNVQRKIIAMGASVVSALFNVYSGLNIAALPITMTAMGTQNVNIPALAGDINIGESGGNWTVGSTTPHAVPLEFDFRLAGSYPSATGRRVLFNMANFALDQERVRLGVAATPDYGDPNRVGAQHVGQFYVLGEQLLILGMRAGSSGLLPFQLKMVPNIDDNQFTVFQRMNTQSKAFSNVEPWGNGGLTQVVSAYVLGLPSTTADTEIDWANATPGLVGISLRGFLEMWSASGAASMPETISGSSANAYMINGTLQSIQNTTQGLSSWLPLAEVTNPTHDGYYIPPQADSRGWPINRNGQIMRGTAAIGNVINKMVAGNAIGARYFTLRNPAVTTAASRYADLYFLSIQEPGRTHIANPYMDPVRGYPDNNLWRLFGPVNSQATLTVTLPFIMPRRAQISGANGIVPDPFEAGNLTNQRLEWDLAESTFDTSVVGINGVYRYQNVDLRWWYEKTAYTSDEKHQFWWQ